MSTSSVDISALTFLVRPSDGGQIVEVSYAYDPEAQVVVRRTYDQSDRSESFATAEDDRETFEPFDDQDFSHLDWIQIPGEPTLAARLLDFDRGGEADETYQRINDAGDGFDPTREIDAWTLVYRAQNTDEVSIYADGDDAILVGTDGMGDDDSRWAVRVSA